MEESLGEGRRRRLLRTTWTGRLGGRPTSGGPLSQTEVGVGLVGVGEGERVPGVGKSESSGDPPPSLPPILRPTRPKPRDPFYSPWNDGWGWDPVLDDLLDRPVEVPSPTSTPATSPGPGGGGVWDVGGLVGRDIEGNPRGLGDGTILRVFFGQTHSPVEDRMGKGTWSGRPSCSTRHWKDPDRRSSGGDVPGVGGFVRVNLTLVVSFTPF